MVESKVSIALGVGGIFIAILGLMLLFIFSLIGITILVKPWTGIALILIIYAILSAAFGQKNSMLPAIALFLGIVLLFGSQVQNFFESLPGLGIIFKTIEVIL